MGAPFVVLDDVTPLNGPTIDVPARIGWTLRMARLVAGKGRFDRLEDMAAAVGTNVTALHRLETGRSRRGALVNRYEQVLGLPDCSLRAPIDLLCRNYPDVAPTDRDPGAPPRTVEGISALTYAVLDGRPTGGDWLAWARAMAQPSSLGLPRRLAEPLMRQLASELGRAVGPARPSRYEALAQLRDSPYGDVLLDVARDLVADPHVEMMFWLLSSVAEVPSEEAESWLVGLLQDPRPRVVTGAAQALERMSATSRDPDFWARLVGPVTRAYDASSDDPYEWLCLSHLVRLIPASELRRARWRPSHPLSPALPRESWERSAPSATWAECEQRARAVTEALGIPEQPMLARLVFDIAISPYENRGPQSLSLVTAVPGLGVLVQDQVAQIAVGHPDPVVQERARLRIHTARPGVPPADDWGWYDHLDPESADVALMLTGMSGRPLPSQRVGEALARGGSSARAAVVAAGMTGDPLLQEISTDDGSSDELRGAARWWLREGPRVVDPGQEG